MCFQTLCDSLHGEGPARASLILAAAKTQGSGHSPRQSTPGITHVHLGRAGRHVCRGPPTQGCGLCITARAPRPRLPHPCRANGAEAGKTVRAHAHDPRHSAGPPRARAAAGGPRPHSRSCRPPHAGGAAVCARLGEGTARGQAGRLCPLKSQPQPLLPPLRYRPPGQPSAARPPRTASSPHPVWRLHPAWHLCLPSVPLPLLGVQLAPRPPIPFPVPPPAGFSPGGLIWSLLTCV